MLLHTLVHWLDDARHEFIGTTSWEAVKTNLGASLWLFAGVTLTWPKLRKVLWAEMKKAEHEFSAVEQEVKRLERDLFLPFRWLGRKLRRRSESQSTTQAHSSLKS